MIPLRTLKKYQRQMAEMSRAFATHYPSEQQPWEGNADDLETIRNLHTAHAHIGGWIEVRAAHKRDPYLVSPSLSEPQVKTDDQ